MNCFMMRLFAVGVVASLSVPAQATSQENPARRAGSAFPGMPTDIDRDDWKTWWFLNRDSLVPAPVDLSAVASTGERTADRATTSRVAIDLLITAMRDESAVVRASAAIALGRYGALLSEADRTALGRVVDDSDASVRDHAIVAVGLTGHESAVTGLIELLEGSARGASIVGESSVADRRRGLAALGLGMIGGDNAIDALARVVRDGKADRAVRVAAITALGRLAEDSGRAIATIERTALADDEPGDIRALALLAAGRTGAARVKSSLLDSLESSDARLRRAALLALGRWSSKQAAPSVDPSAIVPLLRDSTESVRNAAAVVLGQVSGSAAVEHLRPFLRDGARTLRAHAALGIALASRGDPDQSGAGELAKALAEAAANDEIAALKLAAGLVGTTPADRRAEGTASAPSSLREAALAIEAETLQPGGHLPAGFRDALRRARTRFDRHAVVAGAARALPSTETLAALRESIAQKGDLDANEVANAAALLAWWRDAESARSVRELISGERLPDRLRAFVIEALGHAANPGRRDPISDYSAGHDALLASDVVDFVISLKW